jgi:hypothetical protein
MQTLLLLTWEIRGRQLDLGTRSQDADRERSQLSRQNPSALTPLSRSTPWPGEDAALSSTYLQRADESKLHQNRINCN